MIKKKDYQKPDVILFRIELQRFIAESYTEEVIDDDVEDDGDLWEDAR